MSTEFFDREVVRVICTTSTVNLDDHSKVALMNVQMVTRLLYERAKIRGSSKGRFNYQGPLISRIHQAVELLQEMHGPLAEKERLQKTYALCAAAANHLGRYFFGKLRPSSPKNHYEPAVERPLDLLTVAACLGNTTMANALLRSGVDPNNEDDIFGSPLDAAARNGDNKMLLLLLRKGAKLFFKFTPDHLHTQYDALQAAALAGHEHTVKLLLEPKYELDRSSGHYIEAIYSAVHGGHCSLVRQMLQFTTDFSYLNSRYDILFIACIHGHLPLVRMLLNDSIVGVVGHELDWPTYISETTALQAAALRGHTAVIRLLIAHGADIHYAQRESALNRAARNGHQEVAEVLLAHGADINARALRTTPLGTAAANGEVSMLRFLLARGADVHAHKCGEEALFLAAGKGYELVVRALVEAGVDANGPGPEGKSPMLQALMAGQRGIVRALEGLGAERVEPEESIYAAQFASGRFPYVMYKN